MLGRLAQSEKIEIEAGDLVVKCLLRQSEQTDRFADMAGYYLEALVAFDRITGIDPTELGPQERAADERGLSRDQTTALQKVAQVAIAEPD
jgi:hypothetical protein